MEVTFDKGKYIYRYDHIYSPKQVCWEIKDHIINKLNEKSKDEVYLATSKDEAFRWVVGDSCNYRFNTYPLSGKIRIEYHRKAIRKLMEKYNKEPKSYIWHALNMPIVLNISWIEGPTYCKEDNSIIFTWDGIHSRLRFFDNNLMFKEKISDVEETKLLSGLDIDLIKTLSR